MCKRRQDVKGKRGGAGEGREGKETAKYGRAKAFFVWVSVTKSILLREKARLTNTLLGEKGGTQTASDKFDEIDLRRGEIRGGAGGGACESAIDVLIFDSRRHKKKRGRNLWIPGRSNATPCHRNDG